jgi:N-ethylmaleimide reductase
MPNSDPRKLFEPYAAGALQLRNRIVMAPLTRSRAGEGNVPQEINRIYYEQRAGAGLIISEATQVAPLGQGYIWTPGIHSQQQIDGWKRIVDAVHDKGGKMVLQLWHVGRISHPDFHGQQPVAPSAIAPRNMETYTAQGLKPIPEPRALRLDEIPGLINEYRQGAENAKKAGFDGVEVHGANGYLLDQFLQDGTNKRDDAYGGTIESRARLLLEVTDTVIDVWGSDRVGVRLSPGGTFNDMYDSTPQETFGYAVHELNRRTLAYLHLIETPPQDGEHPVADLSHRFFRPMFDGPLMVAAGYTLEKACRVVNDGTADLVAFGKLFIANPDLVERFNKGADLNEPDPSTFYGGTEKGYTDYPVMGTA